MKDGVEIPGVNVENAAYGASICSERSAILSAISNGYKNQLEQYLANNDLSSADCDYIASVADKALEIVKSGSATSVSELTRTEKDKLKELMISCFQF